MTQKERDISRSRAQYGKKNSVIASSLDFLESKPCGNLFISFCQMRVFFGIFIAIDCEILAFFDKKLESNNDGNFFTLKTPVILRLQGNRSI